MTERKYILEITSEDVNMLAYGAVPEELKSKMLEVAHHINSRNRLEQCNTNSNIKKEHRNSENRTTVDKRQAKNKEFNNSSDDSDDSEKSWTMEEDAELIDCFNREKSISLLSEKFKLQPCEIASRLNILGLM